MQTHRDTHVFKVADLFCGAGGSSTGARRAISDIGGEMDLVAVNHWNTAIATHSANHPDARHIVEDVSIVDPESVVEDGYLDILMASPECTYHSRARGGKPIHDQGRMNPWAVMNWLTKLEVRHVLIENVPEFVDWGPLGPDFKPIKSKKGEHFQAWFLNFFLLGYHAEWRILNAADYGDATTRTRFFLMARKDGLPIQWPEPSHAKGDTGMLPGRKRWRGAREIIDWANTGKSLLDDPKYLRKPLSEKTRRRIARGLERFGGPLAPLYIRLLEHQADGVMNDSAPGFIVPSIVRFNGTSTAHDIEDPLSTITAGGKKHGIANPVLVEYYGNSEYAIDVERPLPTVTTKDRHGLVIPSLIEVNHGNGVHGDKGDEGRVRSVDDPLGTLTTKRGTGLANPVLVQVNHGNGAMGDKGNDRLVRSVDDPLPSVTTSPGMGLANPVLLRTGQTGSEGHHSRPLEEPIPSLTTKADVVLATPLASPLIVMTGNSRANGIQARSADQPIPTLTTRNDIAVSTPAAEPYIVPNFGEADGQSPRCHSIEDPTPTVTSRGAGSLVCPVMEQTILQQLERGEMDPRRVVFVNRQPYLLDIRFRMLQNPELARAMGFDDEESSYEFVGNVAEVTKQIGNAVPVNMASALVAAALS